MKVACIGCGKKFVLPDAALRLGGIPVQCGACSRVFTAYRPDDPAAPAPEPEDPNATTQPGDGGVPSAPEARATDPAGAPAKLPGLPDLPDLEASELEFDPNAATMLGQEPVLSREEEARRLAKEAGSAPAAPSAEEPKKQLEIVVPREEPGPRFPTPPPFEPPVTAPAAPAASEPAPSADPGETIDAEPVLASAPEAAPDPGETIDAEPAPLPPAQPARDPSASQEFFGESLGEPAAAKPADPSSSQVFFGGESLGTPAPAAGTAAAGIDPSAESSGGAAWGPDTAATSGFYDAAEGDDAFLLDELYEDPFVKARRRRRKVVLGLLGTLGGIFLLGFVFAKAAPEAFDGLVGRRIGIRTAWDPEAVKLRGEGRVLLFRDDPESLQLAIERLRAAHEKDPEYPEAATDLAAAHFLLSSIVRADGRAVVDEAGDTSARMRVLTDKMKKSRGSKYDRLEKKAKKQLEELKVLDRRSTEFMEEAGKLNAAGYDIARVSHEANRRSPAAMTGLALYYCLEDEPGPAEALLTSIQAFGADPPLARLGKAWLLAVGEFSEKRRTAALVALDALIAAEPDLLRARVGRIQALQDLGREDEARAAEKELLELNPKHPVARLLRRRK